MLRRASSAADDELRGTLALLATIVTWGVTYALSKVALRHLPASELAFVRQAAALPPILWLAWRQRTFLLPVRYLLPLAATGTIGFFLFANLGLERASASVGALVQGIAPVLLGFFGSGLAYVTWNFGIARVPAARAGVYSNLVPVVALLVAWLALGESVGWRQALGGAVVVLGALLASWRGPFSQAAPSITVERCEASGSRRP